MSKAPTVLPEVLRLHPKLHTDARGFLMETFDQQAFDALLGRKVQFVQDFQSHSARHVLRGLHYQLPPSAQGKLVRVVSGRVFDVTVDMRAGSPRFGCWSGTELSADNRRQLWIPPGFAHGFLVLSDGADFVYKTTAYYAPDLERAVRWNDADIGINWPIDGSEPVLSRRDAGAPPLTEAPAVRL